MATTILALLALLLALPALSDAPPGAGPARAVLGADNDTTTPFNLVSLPALIGHHFDGRDLTLTAELHQEPAYRRYAIAYRGGGLQLTGTLALPSRPGKAPVVVVAHGYLPPTRYLRGAGMMREEAALARAGFVVLHPDYRNYGGSTVESGRPVAEPLGYPEDVINAVLALKQAHLRGVDTRRIGLLGRSMGGGVALQAAVARPDLFRAIELYSPVSSLAADDYERWVVGSPKLRERVEDAFGTPATEPELWREASSRSYFNRIQAPVLIAHGTADRTCPFGWSEATTAALHRAGVRATLVPYPGEPHRFDRLWPRFRDATLAYFHARLT